MACPYNSLKLTETDHQVEAVFVGALDVVAAPNLHGFAEQVRLADGPRQIMLDLRAASRFQEESWPALLAIHQAAVETGSPLCILAEGLLAKRLRASELADCLAGGP